MDENRIKEILSGNVDEVKAALPELPRDDLVALRAAEAADSNPRSTVVGAIDRRLAELEEDAPAAPAAAKTDKPKAKPAWQALDYDGPITGEQAAWRRENIKPVTGVRTK